MTAQATSTVEVDAASARTRFPPWWLIAIALVTVAAAVMRLIALGTVPEDLYYDAAVRSMTLSLHNFFFGAFDPSAATSIDKPPLDLWLQVISVKLFGWGPVALKLPEALAGTAAIPLQFDLVRRVAGPLAGLAGAITLAFLPTSVITARSDTMDSVMMLLLLVVAWLLLRGAQRGELRWVMAAAVALGLAFNVKLFEALVPVPAFVVFMWLCWRGDAALVRARRLAVAGAVFVVVAMSWMVAVTIVPTAHRPYAIGSTNGSIWNAVFVFNGLDHITQPPQPRSFSTTSADARIGTASEAVHSSGSAARAPTAHTAAASGAVHSSSTTLASHPGPFRLFQYSLVGYGTRLGTILFAAMAFGLAALAPLLRRRLRAPPRATREQLIAWAASLAIAIWLITGYLLFSFTARVQPRYPRGQFTPAVAIALGCGLVAVGRRARDLFGVYVLLATFAIAMLEGAAETASGKHGYLAIGIGALVAVPVVAYVVFAWAYSARHGPAVAALVCGRGDRAGSPCGAARVPRRARCAADQGPQWRAGRRGVALERGRQSDLALPASPPGRRPLRACGDLRDARRAVHHQRRAARPLLLTTVNANPLVTAAQLRHLAATGQVRYEVNHGACTVFSVRAQCSAAMRWVRAHARDVTSQTGLPPANTGLVYDLARHPRDLRRSLSSPVARGAMVRTR